MTPATNNSFMGKRVIADKLDFRGYPFRPQGVVYALVGAEIVCVRCDPPPVWVQCYLAYFTAHVSELRVMAPAAAAL